MGTWVSGFHHDSRAGQSRGTAEHSFQLLLFGKSASLKVEKSAGCVKGFALELEVLGEQHKKETNEKSTKDNKQSIGNSHKLCNSVNAFPPETRNTNLKPKSYQLEQNFSKILYSNNEGEKCAD